MTLTAREKQIIQSLSEGKTLKEIAKDSGVCYQSVKNKLAKMRKKGKYKTNEQMIAMSTVVRLDEPTGKRIEGTGSRT